MVALSTIGGKVISTLIVGVGGTSQLLLHFYTQLFQIGAIKDPFYAVIMDSDSLLPSLQTIGRHWKAVAVGHPQRTSIPMLDYKPLAENIPGRVEHALAGRALPHAPAIHPVEALFDSESLMQQVNEGLFARPALSAVMNTEWSAMPFPSFAGLQRVIVVGSIIGGTGGGLIAPLLNNLAERIRALGGGDRPRLRAVLFGEYFRVEGANPLVRDAHVRYPSNKLLVGRTLQELAPPELDHFLFVEPPNPIQRNTSREREAINIPWPEEFHPIWMGISALEEARTNTTWPNAVEFKDKECQIQIESIRSLARDMNTLRDRSEVAETISAKSVLTAILSEPWFERFYGTELPSFITATFEIARRKTALRIDSIGDAAHQLQSAYNNSWQELKEIFPTAMLTNSTLPRLRETTWGKLGVDNPDMSNSLETLMDTVSKNILYRALRGGRE
jgi:hypothetical protein